MSILPRASATVAPVPAASACPAHRLDPSQRQVLAVAALAGARPVSHLAADYQASRKFVYLPADGRVLFWLPVTAVWLRRLILALLLICHSSYRGVYELLRDLFHYPCSLGSIHAVAQAAMSRARSLNGQQDLAGVKSPHS